MIRNVVLVRLPDPSEQPDPAAREHARAELEAGLAGIAALRLPGQLDVRVGLDAGLRAGGWSAAITSDWVDEAAYRAYDVDPEHQEYRAQIVAVSTDVARVQFEA
ncbi:Dabb family protein [Nocardioides sp. AX2bis]|uniref:Dabb family protein n=1 Tax=Nocardioides sp. AX2bis TaxID=2653157 RepID=UPI0012EF8348|nr:Dabb family protein [Nocardioides sp. AX2bis]VXC56382.1 Stress protein [Nocardioides sp. AX2bis]